MNINNKIRVVQLIDSLEPGGSERMAVTIANGLIENVSFSGIVVTRLEGGLKNTIGEEVEYLFLNKKKAIDFNALLRFRNYIQSNKVNTIHAHGSSYFFAILLKITLPSVQVFWHDHFGNRVKSSQKYYILRFFSILFSGVFTVNESLKDWAQKKLWVKNVVFLSNFTSNFTDEKKETFLKGDPDKRIVFLANLHHPKNHLIALQSFLASQIATLGWTLHLIGKDKNDSYSDQLKKFIQQNYLQESVFIYGTCNDVNNILKQASVGILVSSYEGFPVTLLEYGMSKLTVICTDVGYCSSIIQNHKTGYLVESDNKKQLEDAFRKVVNENKKNAALAHNLNIFVKDNFAQKKVIQKIILAYQGKS